MLSQLSAGFSSVAFSQCFLLLSFNCLSAGDASLSIRFSCFFFRDLCLLLSNFRLGIGDTSLPFCLNRLFIGNYSFVFSNLSLSLCNFRLSLRNWLLVKRKHAQSSQRGNDCGGNGCQKHSSFSLSPFVASIQIVESDIGDASEDFQEAPFLAIAFSPQVTRKRFQWRSQCGRKTLERIVELRIGRCVGVSINNQGEHIVIAVDSAEVYDLFIDPLRFCGVWRAKYDQESRLLQSGCDRRSQFRRTW